MNNVKKIAVLGSKRCFELFIDLLYMPVDYRLIIDLESIKGVEFESFILLDDWKSAYERPWDLLHLVKRRVR